MFNLLEPLTMKNIGVVTDTPNYPGGLMGNNAVSTTNTIFHIGLSTGTDLAVTVSSMPVSMIEEGQEYIYTITVRNMGDVIATGVEITDDIHSIPDITSSGNNPSVGTYTFATGVWQVGTITGGATESIIINATISEVNTQDMATATATITAVDQTDTNASNDSDSIVITIGQALDLQIGIAVDDNTPLEGDTIQYTLTLTNLSSVRGATNITVVDDIRSQSGTVSASNPSAGTYTEGTGTWTLATLAASGSATCTVDFDLDADSAGT